MSQTEFWKQLIKHTKNWKVVMIGLRHIEMQEKCALTAGTVKSA